MSILPQLERDLLDAANRRYPARVDSRVDPSGSWPRERARARRPRERARARRLRLASIVLGCLLASTTIALAASGVILTGAPVRPEGRLNPSVGEGVPAPGGSRLLSLRVPDPEGGLPWGMRIVRTTRGEVCVQIGRVEHGQLGQLGIDAVFHDDGRFHPMPTDVLPETSRVGASVGDNDASAGVSCHLAGQAMVGVHRGVDRSAGAVVRDAAGGHERVHPSELRDIYYGMLGGPAVSVGYRAGASVRNVAVLQPLGAYLIVRRAARAEQVGSGDEALGSEGDLTPSPPLTTITYRLGGKLCRRGPVLPPGVVERLADPCPAPHWPSARYVAPRDLHQTLRVQLQVRDHLITGTRLSFTAPFAVAGAREDYEIRIPNIACTRTVGEQGAGISWSGSGVSIGRNVTRGSTVTHEFTGLELFGAFCGFPSHVRYVSRRSAIVEVIYRKYAGAVPVIVGRAVVQVPAGTRLRRNG
jgi:hypothetical protein